MLDKRILIFSHEFPPFGGGAGVVAYQYCIELQKQWYDVTLLTRKQDSFPIELNKINIITVFHIPKIWFLLYFLKLKNTNLQQFDTIILNDIAAGFIAGKYFKDDILEKCIPILHGSEPENIYNKPSIFFKLMSFKYHYNNMLEKSQKIIAVSNYMKEKFIDETTFKDANKIAVVYSGLSDDFFIDKEVNCKDIFNYQNKEIILSVSRIEKEKGFLEMYKVFKKLVSIKDEFIWIIVGDGRFKKEFEDIVNKDKLNKKILFKGKVPRDELYKYYKCADIFWLISKYKESFGLVYLEAQAYGCPAIGVNKYGVKEAINNGKTGFLVDSVNDSLKIFIDKKYKNLLFEDLITFVEKFRQDSIVKVL